MRSPDRLPGMTWQNTTTPFSEKLVSVECASLQRVRMYGRALGRIARQNSRRPDLSGTR